MTGCSPGIAARGDRRLSQRTPPLDAAATWHDPADRQTKWIGFSRDRLEAARPG